MNDACGKKEERRGEIRVERRHRGDGQEVGKGKKTDGRIDGTGGGRRR